MIKLKCDKGCKQEFILIGLGTEVIRSDIQKHGFTCPHCGKEYISYYTNSGIRAMQEMQRGLATHSKSRTSKYKRIIKDLQKRIQVGMDRLKEEIENEKD